MINNSVQTEINVISSYCVLKVWVSQYMLCNTIFKCIYNREVCILGLYSFFRESVTIYFHLFLTLSTNVAGLLLLRNVVTTVIEK